MRKSLRTSILALLLAGWPQLGCKLPGDNSAPAPPTVQPKQVTAQKPDAAPVTTAQALRNQAEILEKAGRTIEAIALYEQVQPTSGPLGWEATRKLAQLYHGIGDLYRAQLEYERLLNQHNPRDVDALCNLGWTYYQSGQYGAAYKFLNDAVFLQKDRPTANYAVAVDRLGMTLAQMKNYDASLAEFKKIGKEAEAYRKVAFVLKLQNNRDKAIEYYRRATGLDPSNMQAQRELSMMFDTPPAAGIPNIMAAAIQNTPRPIEKRGNVELEPAPLVARGADEGGSRLMTQRITLPPLPAMDMAPGNGNDWESSTAKKNKN
jgi:tetratricopeptide (TPR) repeat protein